MKKIALLLLALAFSVTDAHALYKNNPYTGKRDYYEAGLSTSASSFLNDYNGTSFADDQIFVADNSSGGTPRTIPDCDDSAGQHLNYDNSTNSFSCGTSTSGSGGWSDGGATITLTTSTDNVGIGGAALGKLSVDGDTDENQLVIQGHSTQTSSIVVIEKSDGTDLVTIGNDGTVAFLGSGTPGATLGDGTTASYAMTSSLSGANDPTLTFIDSGWKWGAVSEDLSGVFTSNTLTYSSSTGVTSIAFTSIGLTTGAASNFSGGTTTLGAVAGAIDGGGATSLEIPNGTAPTVDAEGEIAYETDDDDLHVYDGAVDVVLAGKNRVVFSFSILAPASTSDSIMKQLPRATTITKVTLKCTGGTNVVGRLYEVDGDGDQGDQVGVETGDWTVTTTETEDTSFNNATFDAGDYIAWDTTSVSGSVTTFNVTVEGYET